MIESEGTAYPGPTKTCRVDDTASFAMMFGRRFHDVVRRRFGFLTHCFFGRFGLAEGTHPFGNLLVLGTIRAIATVCRRS